MSDRTFGIRNLCRLRPHGPLQYEKIDDIRQAIHFFKMAGKSSYAAQLAMKTGMDSELLPLSLQVNLAILSWVNDAQHKHLAFAGNEGT